MSANDENATGWSRQRWTALVLLIVALHLGALFIFSARHDAVSSHPDARGSVRWLTSPVAARMTLDTLLDNDPTLLATVNARGFSGAAWLRPRAMEFRAEEWSDTELSLAQPARAPDRGAQPAAASRPPPVLDPARKPAAPSPALAVAQPALRTTSQMHIEGPLASRPLAQCVPLKSWPHPDLLADTRVQVLVSRDGLILSRRLASGGLRNPVQQAADQHAYDLTRELRFEPLPKSAHAGADALAEGTIVFRWHTVEPPAKPVKE